MTVQDSELSPLGPWSGIDNRSEITKLAPDKLREAENVSLTKDGEVQSRVGLTNRASTTSSSGLWSWGGYLIYVDNGALTRMDPDTYTTTALASVDNTLSMSYAEGPDSLWYTNGVDRGRIRSDWTVSPWAPPNPPRQPTVAAGSTGGSLTAGQYQVAVTFKDSHGEESGCGPAAAVTITAGQTITLTDIPQSSDASYISVYLTPVNDERFLWQIDLAMGVTSYTLYSVLRTGVDLVTMFCDTLPAGQHVRNYRGRNYVAKGNAVFFSEPAQLGLYRPMENYLAPMRDRIAVLEPVNDGLWCVTERRTWFYSGLEPQTMQATHVHPYGAVEGSGRMVDAKLFNAQDPGFVAYWFGERGGVIGHAGGQVEPIMEDLVAVDKYTTGATSIFEKAGLRQTITALQGKKTTSGFKASDSAVAEVRKNNVKRAYDTFILSDEAVAEVA